ncbi:MAG: M20/M25/M40 family metallo-hydrolase [Candidatus Shapirobacteria bacterium]|jgi:acetylornithine deacetylase/succinyl-diaminopimelate desuccinylase-like protein
MTKILELTKQLVSIPSWVDEQTNETKIGEFIFDFLKNNTDLSVEKEMVIDGRFNILARNSQDIKTLVMGHIDTVGINNNWKTDPIDPVIKDGKLFGRGTTDMKSGLAAMMLAATNKNLSKNIAFLFYIDEEYDFAGVKKFMVDYGSKIKPKSIISLDGSELNIANGCRGLIEISATVKGKSCHAATPQNGINAIEVATKSIDKLKEFLSQFIDPELGTTSVNLAAIDGRGSSSNVVPDNCQFTLDIRPSSSKINARLIIDQLKKYIEELKGELANSNVKFDFGSWLTPKAKLAKLGLDFKDISTSGYMDTQMLWQIFDQPDCLDFGAGAQLTAHASNEYVEVNQLNKLEKILLNIIQKI